MPLPAEENEDRAVATAMEQPARGVPENRESVSYLRDPAFCVRRAMPDRAGRGFFLRDAGDGVDDHVAAHHHEARVLDRLPTPHAASQTNPPSPMREGTSNQSDQTIRRPMAHFSCTASTREVKPKRLRTLTKPPL